MSSTQHNRPEDIAMIAKSLQVKLETSIRAIQDVYERTHIISINSRIEAARVGEKGQGFKVVAQEFSRLNEEIAQVTSALEQDVREELVNLKTISESMAKDVRARRLSQIGISVMDVIDKNLYERSCDVRWWATDPSIIGVLRSPSEDTVQYASERLGIILDSYTVYLDIVVADQGGRIVATGRPGTYASAGHNVSQATWFQRASRLHHGQEYAFESAHRDALVNEANVLTYSCRVEDAGAGTFLGVLGIFFHWESLVRAAFGRLTHQDLNEDIVIYHIPTEIWIVDETGRVLASLDQKGEGGNLPVDDVKPLVESRDQGYRIVQDDKQTAILAWGYSPGFETYQSGWYCVIRQVLTGS